LPSSLQQSLQGISEKNPADSSASWYDELLAAIRSELAEPDLLANVDLGRLKMSAEGSDLLTQRDAGGLSPADAARLNRLVFEAAFPKVVKQFRGAGWRPTMISYGIVGIAVAIGFLIVSRDLPADHPWCNQSERQLIAEGSSSPSTAAEPEKPPFPMLAILTDLSLWGNSLMQAFTNIGWLFIVTWLPRYLEEVHNVPLKWQAIMTAIPTAAGIVGMYAGGWWTDLATQYAGRKWGRRLPVLITRFTAALGYAICLIVGNVCAPGSDKHWLPWLYVAALCLMAFSVDMGNPAVWGYAQDVGGKFTGSILGWANMWGNLGAAVAPPIYNYILGESPSVADWNTMFAACFGMFVLSGLCSLVMDSTRPLVRTPPAAGSA
jgi:nitrate/nitrite transporter NarK